MPFCESFELEIVNYVLRVECLAKSTSLHLSWDFKVDLQPVQRTGRFIRIVYKNAKCVLNSTWCVAFSSLTDFANPEDVIKFANPPGST